MVQIPQYEMVTHIFGYVTDANVVDGKTAGQEALGVVGRRPRSRGERYDLVTQAGRPHSMVGASRVSETQ